MDDLKSKDSLADANVHLSNERTHLSYVRTATSLMSFGIALNKFGLYLQQENRVPSQGALSSLRDIENTGLGMVLFSMAIMGWSFLRYRRVYRSIVTKNYAPPGFGVAVITSVVLLLGAASTLWMILG
jgi:putative membrane protein